MQFEEVHLETIDSTQSYAKREVARFSTDGVTCISAEEQTEGKGRFQRKWISPKGVNLYLTFYFALPLNTLHLMSLGQVMTYSFASLLLEDHLPVLIKWPNDVLLNGKKVAGVLTEISYTESLAQIFLGIGINVNMDASQLKNIEKPATSLKEETHKTWDRKELFSRLKEQFVRDLELFRKEGFYPFHRGFEKILAFKGETIHCFDGKKEWVGVCHSLRADGQLNLFLPEQKIQPIFSGEIL